MAKAPKVKPGGYEAAEERMAKAQQVYRIEVPGSGVAYSYAPYGVPIGVRAKVRDVTGMSVDQLLFARGDVDVQTYADMWWISRLHDGEEVTREAVWAEWDEKCPGTHVSDIVDRLVEDPDDPKASEPAG